MTLREQQSKFSLLVAHLILNAYNEGFEVTLGDAWAREGHIKDSLHYSRLAIDINLFKNGRYLKRTEDHEVLGTYWESLDPDCKWGGRFGDGNHYEMCRP